MDWATEDSSKNGNATEEKTVVVEKVEVPSIYEGFQLILSMNYRKMYNRNTVYHTHRAYDVSFIVINMKNNCQIVDGTTLHYPLHNAFSNQVFTRKFRGKMKSYSFKDLNRDLDERIKKFGINFVWVYSDNQILRRLDALKSDSLYIVNLKETSKKVGELENLCIIDLNEPYNIDKINKNDSVLNTLATWLIAGYDVKTKCLYSPAHYINPQPCDAHKFCLDRDKYLCASTLTMINRISVMLLLRMSSSIEELKNIIIKLMYPGEKCPDEHSILETFSSRLYNMSDSHIDHSKSDAMNYIINYLGYGYNVYSDLKGLP